MPAIELKGHYRIVTVQGPPLCLTGIERGETLHVQPPTGQASTQVWDVRQVKQGAYHLVLEAKPDWGASAFPDPKPRGFVRLLEHFSAFAITDTGAPDEFIIKVAEAAPLTLGTAPGEKEVVLLPTGGENPFVWRFVRA